MRTKKIILGSFVCILIILQIMASHEFFLSPQNTVEITITIDHASIYDSGKSKAMHIYSTNYETIFGFNERYFPKINQQAWNNLKPGDTIQIRIDGAEFPERLSWPINNVRSMRIGSEELLSLKSSNEIGFLAYGLHLPKSFLVNPRDNLNLKEIQ